MEDFRHKRHTAADRLPVSELEWEGARGDDGCPRKGTDAFGETGGHME